MIDSIIQTTFDSFDFTYCIIVNILTYLIIKIIDNKRTPLTTWKKRLVLVSVIVVIGVLYWIFGSESKVLLNSAILAPVFWSWIMKPICKHFNVDYKQIDMFK